MSPIEDTAAAVFFADLLLPLHHANARRAIAYLKRGREGHSHWGEVVSRTGGIERLPADCDAALMLNLLARYWRRRNETPLLQLIPHLAALQRKLSGAPHSQENADAPLTEFVYPLF
jgi:hypothetical protein